MPGRNERRKKDVKEMIYGHSFLHVKYCEQGIKQEKKSDCKTDSGLSACSSVAKVVA